MAEETESIAEKMQAYINSEVGQNIKTVLAYSIKASSTTTDDEIVDNAEAIATVLADALASLEDEEPSEKQAKKAAVEVLKWVASKTKTKIDDVIVGALSIFY